MVQQVGQTLTTPAGSMEESRFLTSSPSPDYLLASWPCGCEMVLVCTFLHPTVLFTLLSTYQPPPREKCPFRSVLTTFLVAVTKSREQPPAEAKVYSGSRFKEG